MPACMFSKVEVITGVARGDARCSSLRWAKYPAQAGAMNPASADEGGRRQHGDPALEGFYSRTYLGG
jgi:hypothetical protein